VNDLATNREGEGDSARAPSEVTETPVEARNTESESSTATDNETEVETAAKDPGKAEPDDTDEVEHEGRKYRVPKVLKGAFLMHADYTRKTQEVAEQRRALDERQSAIGQQAQLLREHSQDVSRLIALNDQIAQFDKVEWAGLRQSNPETAQDLWFHYMQLQDARNKATGELQAKVTNRTQELQRHAAKRFEEGRAILQRDIKDWSPDLAGKLTSFGVKELGFTPEEISAVSDPRLIKLMHRAYQGDQAIKTAAAAAKLKAQEGVQPPAQVGASASPNVRKPSDASGDKLSADEWMRRRNEQLRTPRRG
jgi:hypothetical protein